ncbi:MAG TPA: 16S rRNA (cytosine(1402)-N(4))-methyltransferase RsmH [Myxococcota bacterium]|nr:16S rRNA (cytosine(1402)-N(4))-methyltransferase RsmH [Myxococcota bacterium]
MYHQPVLLEETLHWLGARPGRLVVDGTLGDGGHAEAILERTAPGGRLVGLDRDADALRIAGERLARFGARVSLAHASFRDLAAVLADAGAPCVDGVLLDLGVSSRQLDEPERGFRFGAATSQATPLDMRMDPSRGESASELLARASEDELARWFREYGELPGAGRLAREIVRRRAEQPLRTSADLLDAIRAARIGGGRKHNPATLAFQALRIAVNDELGALETGLGAAIDALRPGGRLCVIAYHSLEDRIAKQRFAREERPCVCPPSAPVCTCGRKPRLARATRKAVRPSELEVRNNPRARSARLRAAEKLPEAA